MFQDMNLDSRGSSQKSSNGVSDQFPVDLRILVVDDDMTCLLMMDKLLRKCDYQVTKCQRADEALSILRENKGGFDIVISDIHMPTMDGFKLLEIIGREMNLPVIMMSADDKKDVVMKGVTHGACDYLIKPVRIEAIKNIWQHVFRKRRNEVKELVQSNSIEYGDSYRKPSEDADYACSVNEGNWRHLKRRKDEEDEGEERDDTSTLKKPRVVWSGELHQQFITAVNQLGSDKAVPKKIMEFMNVPGLTRENVASHLQKYRLYRRRQNGLSQHQSGLTTPFMGPQEVNFGVMSSLERLDLQAIAVPGQVPPQNLTTAQAEGHGNSTANSEIGKLVVDQRKLFSFQAPKLIFGAGQQVSNSTKQVNLLHGLPTTMEQKQLEHLPQSVHSFGSKGLQVCDGALDLPNSQTSPRTSSSAQVDSVYGNQNNSLMVQMDQPRPRSQILNGITGGNASGFPLSIEQPIFSNASANLALGRNGHIINGATYNPVSQASTMVDFPMNHVIQLPRNGFPLGSTAGVSTLTSTRVFQGGGNSEIKGWRGFPPSYDFPNEPCQGKPQDWQSQSVAFEMSQHTNFIQGNMAFSPSALVHQGFTSSENNGQNKNSSTVCKAMVSLREQNEIENPENIAQCHNNLLVDNAFWVNAESLPDLSSDAVLFAEHFGPDALMSTLFKQQEGVGPVESEFNFDANNILV